MEATETNKHRSYDRGSLGDGYLRREFGDYLASGGSDESSAGDTAVAAYFDYHVSRLVNLFVISGSTDMKSLVTMLTTIVQTAFQVFLSEGRKGLRESECISGAGRVFYRPVASAPSTVAELGGLGSGRPGVDMITGTESAEAVPCLEASFGLSAVQLESLRAHPRVLRHLMNALEGAVPLNLDYRVVFSVDKSDHSFRLSRNEKTGSSPFLGITSSLGSG